MRMWLVNSGSILFYIADAMNDLGEDNISLWDEDDGFYYDVLHLPNIVQLAAQDTFDGRPDPAFAVATIEPDVLRALPDFQRRMRWFIDNRPELTDQINCFARTPGKGERLLLAVAYRERLERVLKIIA